MDVALNHVTKYYNKVPVLNNISFNVQTGDRIAVLGSNGAGKTTLLEIIATLLKPDRGSVIYDGHRLLGHRRAIRKKIGYVPQDLALFPRITVQEQLEFWAGMAPVQVKPARIQELTKLVGLTPDLHKRMERLSGGMKRKLNIILSLLHDPELLVLDEPTVGIDVQTQLEIIEFMNHICTQGTTLLFSSHNILEIQKLCTKAAYLHQGSLLFFGAPAEAAALVRDKKVAGDDGWKAFSFLFNHFL